MDAALPTISLCIITKNEAHCIGDCIRSVLPIVHEVILVDTGSTDETVSIASKLGARIFQREWDNDFSAPRNLSLQHATSDWILVLDADEVIAASDLDDLHALTTRPGVAYEFLQRHYSNDHRISSFTPCVGEYPTEEKSYGGYFVSNLCRLFPNRSDIRYRNRVHELVEDSIHENTDLTILRTRIPIHHYGHTPEAQAKKNKSALYTPLGARKVVDDPEHWKNHFELAVELNTSGNLAESVQAFRSAAALQPEYTQIWINLGYVLNELRAYGSALEALNRALSLEPSNPEAHCNIAVTYMRLQRPLFAESHLKRALAERPQYTNALCNLGQTYFMQKKFPEARECYERVLKLFPKNVAALSDLGAVLTHMGQHTEAIVILEEAISVDKNFLRSHYYLSLALKQNDQIQDALKTLENIDELLGRTGPSDPVRIAIEKTRDAWQSNLRSTDNC